MTDDNSPSTSKPDSATSSPSETSSDPSAGLGKVRDFFATFRDLFRLPAAFWHINVQYMIDSMGYFGVLTLMTIFLRQDLGFTETRASLLVSVYTGAVTLFMIGVAGLVERAGIRKGILIGLGLGCVGRLLYSGCTTLHGLPEVAKIAGVCACLIVMALGAGILQPISYAGIKQYTDEKTNAMGYGLLYAAMNLGIVLISFVSPLVRVSVDEIVAAQAAGEAVPESALGWMTSFCPSGVSAMNWVCTGVTAAAVLYFFLTFSKRVEANKLRAEEDESGADAGISEDRRSISARVIDYFRDGPFANARFVFFIFMLLPVQTLFAHQWLTMPEYIIRAYDESVGNRMEWLVGWTNPAIIVVGVPIATALTRRVNVYTMMIVGTLVSALPTFLLAGGPSLSALITYLVIFSIGEALWQPRFLHYAAELAPPGKVAQYMGLANVPWITAKFTTGLYSGAVLASYCPVEAPRDTGTMWLIYSFIAMCSPIGLILGRKWVMRGLQTGRPTVDAGASDPAE